jgi:hypothetical protein
VGLASNLSRKQTLSCKDLWALGVLYLLPRYLVLDPSELNQNPKVQRLMDLRINVTRSGSVLENGSVGSVLFQKLLGAERFGSVFYIYCIYIQKKNM